MRPTRLLTTLLALLLAGAAVAGGYVSGGVRLTLDDLSLEATYERPSLDAFGVRWGPVLSTRARVPLAAQADEPASLQVLAGVSGTINVPSSAWAVQVQILTRAAFSTTSAPAFTPELLLAFTLPVP